MDTSVFNQDHIVFDDTATTQMEAFRIIAHKAFSEGYVQDEEAYFQGLCEREKEATTGFQDGIAIPHSKHTTCIKPGVFLVRFAHPIPWNALDGEPITVALGLTIPEAGGETHLRILSKLARQLIHDDFRQALKNSDHIEELCAVLAAVEI